MDSLPFAPLLGTLALALLWAALFTAVDAARQLLNGHARGAETGEPNLPAQALVFGASLGKLLVLGLACLIGQRHSGEHGFWLGGLAASLALLVLAEYLPRRLARRNPRPSSASVPACSDFPWPCYNPLPACSTAQPS